MSTPSPAPAVAAPTVADYASRVAGLRRSAAYRACTIDGRPLSALGDTAVLTVVTVCLNSAATIERTLRSVLGQTYRAIEYIVIDGGSTDGTVEILERYADSLSYWHSARDAGISDAFNLGVSLASGRYVALVNADDWMSPDQAQLAVEALERTGAAFAFGDLAFHGTDGALRYVMQAEPRYWHNIGWRMPNINHPTVVVRRTVYESVGLFDPRWRIAMDYDWHLRAELAGHRGVHVPGLLGHMSEGGVCDRNWAGGLAEVRRIAVWHGRSRVRAGLAYYTRLARGHVRLALRRWMPGAIVDRLHRLVNPRFRPVERA